MVPRDRFTETRFGINLILLLGLSPRDRLNHLLMFYLSAPKSCPDCDTGTLKKKSFNSRGHWRDTLGEWGFTSWFWSVLFLSAAEKLGLYAWHQGEQTLSEFQQHSPSWFYSPVTFLGGSAAPLLGSFPTWSAAPSGFLLFHTMESSKDAPLTSLTQVQWLSPRAVSGQVPHDLHPISWHVARLAATHVDRVHWIPWMV